MGDDVYLCKNICPSSYLVEKAKSHLRILSTLQNRCEATGESRKMSFSSTNHYVQKLLLRTKCIDFGVGG